MNVFNTFAVPLPYVIIIRKRFQSVYINDFRNMLDFLDMLNFFDGRAPLRQETSRMAVNCATAPTAYTVADLLYHTRRLYKIYSGLVKRMLAMLLCLSYIDFITYIDSVLFFADNWFCYYKV